MMHRPQSLTRWPTLALLAVSAVGIVVSSISPIPAMAQQQDAASSEPPAAAAPPPMTKSDLTAEQVFDQISETLDGVEMLSCDISQVVVLSGQRFHAVGRYVSASGNRMRLEYRIFPARAVNAKDAEQLSLDATPEDTTEMKVTGSLEQVSDGSVLWSKWVNGPQKQLTRRNIREIVEAVSDVPNYSAARSLQDLGVGGLQTLMSQLQVGMEFGEVREQTSGDTKRLLLTGRWSDRTLKEVFQLPENSNAALPDYIPDYVRIFVDAKEHLPLRIQYLKKHPDTTKTQVRAVVTLDFRHFDLTGEVDDSVFKFERSEDDDIKEVDLTAAVIDGIRKLAADPQATTDSEKVEESGVNP